jgi:hypothetical protein
MQPKSVRVSVKPRTMIALSVPIGILVANILVPLRPIVQQALIGVTLIWFFILIMNGFGF